MVGFFVPPEIKFPPTKGLGCGSQHYVLNSFTGSSPSGLIVNFWSKSLRTVAGNGLQEFDRSSNVYVKRIGASLCPPPITFHLSLPPTSILHFLTFPVNLDLCSLGLWSDLSVWGKNVIVRTLRNAPWGILGQWGPSNTKVHVRTFLQSVWKMLDLPEGGLCEKNIIVDKELHSFYWAWIVF